MRLKYSQSLFVLIIATIFCVAHFVYASGLTWSQNDWSDDSNYSNASGIVATSTGFVLQIKNNWYDTAWKYRQTVSVTNNSGSDLNNYQIPIYINTAELISDSKMTADCRDIRVLDSNGNVLPIWIATSPTVNACNQSNTKVWVKTISLPTAETSFYIYYGNSSASEISSGNSVFPIFADFTTSSSLPDGWIKTDIGTTGDAEVGSGALSISNTNGEDVWETVYGATHVHSTSTISNSFIAETLITSQTGSEGWAKAGMSVQNSVASGVNNGQAFIVTTPDNGIAFQYQFQGGERCPGGICEPGLIAANVQTNGGSYSFPSFLKLIKNNSSQVGGYYSSDGRTWNQQGETLTPLGIADTQYVTLFVTPHSVSGTSTATYSFFYVRSYSDSEPTVSALQDEESFYLAAGSLTSLIFDTGGVNDFGLITYSYTTATNTTVSVKIRTSNNSDMSGSSDFSLCDSILSEADISTNNCVSDRQRYVQYQVSLNSSNGFYTPRFESFNLNYEPTPSYTLNYPASTGGYLSGSSTQTIYYNDDGSSVTAKANDGCSFSGWSDGSKEISRLDENIKSNFSVIANFTCNLNSSFVAPSVPKISLEPVFSNNNISWSVANAYQMSISDSKDFSKVSWVPFEASYKNTNKTLYIKFRSPDGGESQVYIVNPVKQALINKEETKVIPITNKKTLVSGQIFNFKSDLKLGMDNLDVKELQRFLNNNGFPVVFAGVGSFGQESTYFGRMTRTALIKFQKANNITPALGFFGPITRKIITEKMGK